MLFFYFVTEQEKQTANSVDPVAFLRAGGETLKRPIADLRTHGYIKSEPRYRSTGANSSLLFTITEFSKSRTTKG